LLVHFSHILGKKFIFLDVTGYVEKDTVTETEKNERKKKQQGYGCDARRFRVSLNLLTLLNAE
jgi:hypothetical protein